MSDLISKQAAIDIVKFECGKWKGLAKEICKQLENLQSAESEWIPVSERLPDDDEMKLVSCKAKNGNVSVNRAYYADGFWHGSGSMAGVQAWMPLPKPYKTPVVCVNEAGDICDKEEL